MTKETFSLKEQFDNLVRNLKYILYLGKYRKMGALK